MKEPGEPFGNPFNGGGGAGWQRPPVEPAFKPGDLIGGTYEVHRFLGRGGFGEVYLVYSREERIALALKTFRQQFLGSAKAREDFKREALLWLNLEEHPFILVALLVEEISGRLLVAMEYVAPDDQGRVTLADHLVNLRQPLGTDQALLWAIQFCYGMEHANRHGIKCHRDIKPANILIRQDGKLLISDFGLAAATEAAWRAAGGTWEGGGGAGAFSSSLLRSGAKGVAGTPGYIAPEVFEGKGADLRSDIYSFGLVLWQMAAGSAVPPFAVGVLPPPHPPGSGDIERYALQIYERQITERAPAVAGPLQRIIERCLSPEPSRRFADFLQLRADLEPIIYRRTGWTFKPPARRERSAAFWNNRGVSLDSLGRHDEAIACFKKALDIEPDDAMTHNNVGVALHAKGDLEGAIAEYRTAIRLQPESAGMHYNLGVELEAKGDLDDAIAEYRMTIRLQPDFADAHASLGVALKARGDLDGAIAEYRAAIRLQPDCAEAHSKLGHALKGRGDLDGAIAEFRTAIGIQPDYAPAYNNLAVALAETGDLDGAIAQFRTAIRLQPGSASAHHNLGGVLAHHGNLDDAISEWLTAIHLQPDLAQAHHCLGDALRTKGDLSGAISEYRATLRLQPDNAQTHKSLGLSLAAGGSLGAAITAFRAAIRLRPDDAEAHYNLGIALKAEGELDAAIAEYREAIRLKPDLANAHNNLGVALQAKGDLDRATAQYRAAVRLQPECAEARYNLSAALWERGDEEESFEQLRKAYALAPNSPTIRDTYERLMGD
jgi:tetratricopeptide (TPR) repeat protein